MLTLPGWAFLNSYNIIVLALLLYFNEWNRQKTRQILSFRRLLHALLLTMLGDSLSRLPNDLPQFILSAHIGNFMVYALDPICYCCIIAYIEACANLERPSFFTRFLWRPLAAVNLLLLLFNVLFHVPLFYYLKGSSYHRGILYTHRAVVMLSLCIAMEGFIFVHRKDFQKSYFLPLALFPLLSLFFGILQVIFLGASFQYMGLTLSCLLLFIYIQNRDINEDYLTGVLNRRGLYSTLDYAIKDRRSRILAVIMLDLDKFKLINDRFGHQAGDQALIDLSLILRACFRRTDTIGRFGGDEFCVLVPLKETTELEAILQRLREGVAQFNEARSRPYLLEISLGAAVYSPARWHDVDSFLGHVDALLYEEKERHHALP